MSFITFLIILVLIELAAFTANLAGYINERSASFVFVFLLLAAVALSVLQPDQSPPPTKLITLDGSRPR
jgi:hypothetical protein